MSQSLKDSVYMMSINDNRSSSSTSSSQVPSTQTDLILYNKFYSIINEIQPLYHTLSINDKERIDRCKILGETFGQLLQIHTHMMATKQDRNPIPSDDQINQSLIQYRKIIQSIVDHYNNNNNNSNNNINNNPQNIKMEVDKKLRIDLQQIYDRENEQLSTLASKRKQLETRSTQMDDILTQLDNEKNLLCERKNKLELKIKELELWLSKNETNDEFDIDKVIIPSDTWSKQCMEAVSNDYAITDTMLELDKCIEDEVIKLDPYLKQLRKLGRQQFTHKALAKAVFNKQDQMVKRRANNVY